ncbi:MAG: substrate-binding domain-containing protein [Actinobacteria bacterium]|jgi:ABC-type sugar transport system substrate-binding protein|nr:substrate-binding domain-containing protein [Actinomycetota bacterium]
MNLRDRAVEGYGMEENVGMERNADVSRRSILRTSALVGAGIGAAQFLGASPASALGGTTDVKLDKAIRAIVKGRTIKVGFTPPVLSENFTQIENAAWRKMAEFEKRFGVKWVWERQAPVGDFNAVQGTLGIVQSWISRRFDAIAVCTGANFATVQDLYKTANSKGLKVFQFNQPAELYPESQLETVSNIGYDNRWQSGYLAGTYLAQALGGKGKILQIWGPSGSDWTRGRKIGFDKALKENPGIKVVGEADGGYVRDKGFTAAQDLLTKYPDVNAIYGENEEMALGASQAIDAAGLKHWNGKTGILTIGADGLVSGFKAIAAGKLTATVDIGGIDQGQNLIEAIFSTVALGQTVTQIINNPTQVVDKTNYQWHQAYAEWALATTRKYGK